MNSEESVENIASRRSRRTKRIHCAWEQELAVNLLATGYSIEEAAYIAGVRSSDIREWYTDKGFKRSLFALRESFIVDSPRNNFAR
ncbi:MAG TPA: hypothetical protein VIG62_20140 [Blastocatellia bacterium]|jgi:hypothetical protein